MQIEDILKKYISNIENQKKIMIYLETITKEKEEQKCILYETISNSTKTNHFFERMKTKQFLFDHSKYNDIRHNLEEQQRFIDNPPVMEDGVIECYKCKSKKTYSYAKQTRASDEGTSVFVRCAECQHQFRL